MTWRDAICLAVSSLRASAARTVLTILGLAVGIGAVLTVLSLGSAGESRVEDEIAKLGVNKVWVRARSSSAALCQGDSFLVEHASSAPACAGIYGTVSVIIDGNVTLIQAAGFDDGFQTVHTPKLLEGRMFSADEFVEDLGVCLIDETLAEQLGGGVVGTRITVGYRRLVIIGVIKKMTMQTMTGANGLLILPLQSYLNTLGGRITELTLSVPRNMDAQHVAETAVRVLNSGDSFRADTLSSEIQAAREVVRIFVMVLFSVAVVSVLTGGIGVMNILLVSVRERRQEIGLIKAVGGTSAQVGLLFLLEACAYALVGGVLGVLLGAFMITVFGRWIGLNASLNAASVIPVLICAAFLGILFGAAPAVKAAGMAPVDALQTQ